MSVKGVYASQYKTKCNSEFSKRDTIAHSLFECRKVYPFVEKIFSFLISECKAATQINFSQYMFGIPDRNKEALNQIFIEIKRFIFYDWGQNTSNITKLRILKNRLRRIILLDKRYFYSQRNFSGFFLEMGKFYTYL